MQARKLDFACANSVRYGKPAQLLAAGLMKLPG
jgi:hypothetical protein